MPNCQIWRYVALTEEMTPIKVVLEWHKMFSEIFLESFHRRLQVILILFCSCEPLLHFFHVSHSGRAALTVNSTLEIKCFQHSYELIQLYLVCIVRDMVYDLLTYCRGNKKKIQKVHLCSRKHKRSPSLPFSKAHRKPCKNKITSTNCKH